MKKKIYMSPEMEVIEINMNQQILAGSLPMGSGDVNPINADSPEFVFDEEFIGF